MIRQEDPASLLTRISPGRPLLSLRQTLGILLIFLILMTGRLVRSRLLLGPEGQWRKQLWLDELVLSADPARAEEIPPKPQLTTPLPINSCSQDSLTLLPGVGPVLADRIEEVRRSGTVFRTPGDLEIVKGIGPKLSLRLGPLIDFRDKLGPMDEPDSLTTSKSLPDNSR